MHLGLRTLAEVAEEELHIYRGELILNMSRELLNAIGGLDVSTMIQEFNTR